MLNQSADLDLMFRALADGNRRAIIDHLLKGKATVSDLAEPMAISLPAVMQHLAVLEESGLVSSAKSGRVRICSLDPQALGQVENWIGMRRRLWETRLKGLGKFLARDDTAKDRP